MGFQVDLARAQSLSNLLQGECHIGLDLRMNRMDSLCGQPDVHNEHPQRFAAC